MAAPDKKKVVEFGIPIVVGLSVLVLGSLLNSLSTPVTAASALLFLLIAFVSAITAGMVSSLYFDDSLSSIKNEVFEMRTLLTSLSVGKLIVDDEYVVQYESACNCRQIWIITPDLHKDVETPNERCFKDIVRTNVQKRNIRYTWLVSDTPTIAAKITALMQPYTPQQRKYIRVIKLSADRWKQLPYRVGDFAIYNPLLEQGMSPIQGMYELPLKDRKRWVVIDQDTVIAWVGEIQQLVPEIVAS